MRRDRARGVTLVEVMIVVAIVGILATLGFVGWRKITNSSHTVEATHMIGGIRAAQEKYHAEVGRYANVSTNLAYSQSTHHDALYPHCAMSTVREPGNYKVAWGAACSSTTCCLGTPNWSSIQVTTDAPVFYGYSTVAGSATQAPPAGIPLGQTTITYPATILNDWFVATAVGDVDGNGRFSTVIGTSFDNIIRVDLDGE